MDAIFEAYLAAQRRRRPSPLTLKAIRHALGQTQRWLDEHDLAAGDLTLLACEEYFDELLERQAVSTVRRHLAYVRAAYRYAVRHELVERDPTADVRLPRLPDHDPATYSNEQLRAIHAAVRSEREELVFFLFAFAGLRLGEVAGLEWRQVEFEHWQLRLAGKGGKLRLVPLHPAVTELLREQRTRSGRQEQVLGTINGQRAGREHARPVGARDRRPRRRPGGPALACLPPHRRDRHVRERRPGQGDRADHGLGAEADVRTPLPPRRRPVHARGDPRPLRRRPDLRPATTVAAAGRRPADDAEPSEWLAAETAKLERHRATAPRDRLTVARRRCAAVERRRLAVTKAENSYDYAGQDPINSYDLTAVLVYEASEGGNPVSCTVFFLPSAKSPRARPTVPRYLCSNSSMTTAVEADQIPPITRCYQERCGDFHDRCKTPR